MPESTTTDVPQAATKPLPVKALAMIGAVVLAIIVWFAIPGINARSIGKTIPGMSLDNIVTSLQERGFTADKNFSSNKTVCKRDRYLVEIVGLTGGVTSVKLTVDADTSSGEPTFAFDDRKLMGYVASMPYDNANTDENIHWAELHFDAPAKRVDNNVEFETLKESTTRTLTIRVASKPKTDSSH